MLKGIISLFLIGLGFLCYLLIFIFFIRKKGKKVQVLFGVSLVVFLALSFWVVGDIAGKSYRKIREKIDDIEVVHTRSGIEIYEALFDPRETDCIQILHYKDQIIPKIDVAIYLHFKTCPAELQRILSKQDYRSKTIATKGNSLDIPNGSGIAWLDIASLGDSVNVYEYASPNRRNIQTIWTNVAGNEVFVRDVLD